MPDDLGAPLPGMPDAPTSPPASSPLALHELPPRRAGGRVGHHTHCRTRGALAVIDTPCPFCTPEANRIFFAGRLTLGIWDTSPVSAGHALIVPKRHVLTWFDATSEEHAELLAGITVACREIERSHKPDGYNFAVNVGEAAGQTLAHLHVHVVPRYRESVHYPIGSTLGIRPTNQHYPIGPDPTADIVADRELEPDRSRLLIPADAPHRRALIVGGEDPLLPHIRAHLDHAESADFAVAFVLESGVRLLEEHLADLLARGGRLRFVTGDYLGVTDPNALLRLLDLQEEYPEHAEFRVFESAGGTFHPKSFIFLDRSGEGVAFVGSSNLTRPALLDGIEWNFRTVTSRDRPGFATVLAEFERLFTNAETRPL